MATDLSELTGASFREIASDDLSDDGLRALVELASLESYEGCSLVSCYRSADDPAEAVVVQVYIELGQAECLNDVREWEPVAMVMGGHRTMPSVFPIRPDFPQQLPHLNLNLRGLRRSLCLFDAAAEDIAHLYNPAMLIERVRWWMKKSAYGELHGEDQPLDPALAPSFLTLFLPPDFDRAASRSYVAFRRTEHPYSPIILCPSAAAQNAGVPQYACSHILTESTRHGSMIDLPSNLSELIEIYGELGVDLTNEIEKILPADLTDPASRALIQRSLLLLITTPLTDAGGRAGATTTRAFLNSELTLLDVAKSLGLVAEGGGEIARLLQKQPDVELQKSQQVLPLDVVDGFSPSLARRTSGYAEAPTPTLAAIGLGALGSQAVMNLARMGQSTCSLIDQDFIAPHNLARHAASGSWIGYSKAEVVAEEICQLFQTKLATGFHAVVGYENMPPPALEALSTAERVIDFSASVRAARWLAASTDFESPVSSYFVNPSGTALVAMHEGIGRRGRGGEIEAAYYAMLVENENLQDHLATPGQVQLGSCRNLSVTIPQARMAIFAGLAAEDIVATHESEETSIKIWSLNATGAVTVERQHIHPFDRFDLGDWKVLVSSSVRAAVETARADGAVETGGILLGSYDLSRRTLFITVALLSPTDSKTDRSYFDRGVRGVRHSIGEAERVSRRHVTYLGEWHTHPSGANSNPSNQDLDLLTWIAQRRQPFLMPGVLLICGHDGLRLVLQWKERTIEGLAATERH
jgi:integrative and conjugative element protein (TIGR02256 family)